MRHFIIFYTAISNGQTFFGNLTLTGNMFPSRSQLENLMKEEFQEQIGSAATTINCTGITEVNEHDKASFLS